MRIISVLTAVIFILGFSVSVSADEEKKSYTESYVLMEASTKTVIRQRDGNKRVRMGSLNKLMTVLLAAEAVDRGELSLDTELAAGEYENSLQGAKIWLMPGEKMTLSDLLKGVIIGNANDAAAVIAVKLGGSEERFAHMMNERAAELGMTDTFFVNSTGYYRENEQYTTAKDAALLLAELSAHEELRELFTCRIDELKGGEVQLVTTNRMAHKYKGSIGFKCGFGPDSGYFAAEGAQRNGISFVCAVMDCEDEDTAMALAAELLDTGFGGYTVTAPDIPKEMPDTITVKEGNTPSVRLTVEPAGAVVVPIGRENDVTARIYLPDYVYAPLEKGVRVGQMDYYLGDKLLRTCQISAGEDIGKKNFLNALLELMKCTVSF